VRKLVPVLAAALALSVAALSGCGKTDKTPGTVDVVAAFYPLQFLAEQIGGDHVAVTNLVKPGAEPHDLELSPKQVAAISDADLVLYLHSLQPTVDAAVRMEAGGHALDVTKMAPLVPAPAGSDEPDALDPHIWLDPVRFTAISEAVADRLAAVDPAHAADYAANEAALTAKLIDLNQRYATGLADCRRHDIVTSHAAFGYLAARYHLTQVPITGLAPEAEPTPRKLADVAKLARSKGVTTIFFETLVSPKIADTLAREIGAQAQVLDPIEGIEPGSSDTYLTAMNANLNRLRTALGCT
jgi:zinc transport system substrate-binding protein